MYRQPDCLLFGVYVCVCVRARVCVQTLGYHCLPDSGGCGTAAGVTGHFLWDLHHQPRLPHHVSPIVYTTYVYVYPEYNIML